MTDCTCFKEYDQWISHGCSQILYNYWLLRGCQLSCAHPNSRDVSCWNSSLTSQGNRLTCCTGSPWLLGPVPVSQGTWPAWTLLWTRRQGCRGNLEGSEARGESPESTGKEYLLVLTLVGKKLVNNGRFLNLKTHMVYNRMGAFQSQTNSVFNLLKVREPVTHSRQ